MASYDVVIVGGRPAGLSLAARLGAKGLSVLVVDKASFPSLPEVPSCPVLYQGAMRLLDEIGFTEDLYEGVTKVSSGKIVFEGYFHTIIDVPEVYGRSYVYGFDRASFDYALWKHLATFPSVERRSGFRVTDLIRDSAGKVIGIEGAPEGSPKESIQAKYCVVGADGRHSLIARKVGAVIVEDCSEKTSTVHFAEWEGLAPVEPDRGPMLQIVTQGRGRNVLFFPSSPGRVSVATHVRSDRANTEGDAQKYYLGHLNSFEEVRRRIQGARQVGSLLGLKQIANRYLHHGGPGWVLLGDALHHKDPVDGQGIYDALIESKHLAELLVSLHQGSISWEKLLADYQQAVTRETKPMFKESMKRIQRELYQEPPAFIIKTAMRWLMQDPAYHRQFMLFLSRSIHPEGWLSPSLVLGALKRGAQRDLKQALSRFTS